jgi:hypothetical protein
MLSRGQVAGSTLPLILKSTHVNQAFLLTFLGGLRVGNDAVKEPIFALEICASLGPRDAHLMTFLDLNYLGQVIVVSVIDVRDFLGDKLLPWFLHTVNFENVLGSLFCFSICKQHFIIYSPVFVVLLQ